MNVTFLSPQNAFIKRQHHKHKHRSMFRPRHHISPSPLLQLLHTSPLNGGLRCGITTTSVSTTTITDDDDDPHTIINNSRIDWRELFGADNPPSRPPLSPPSNQPRTMGTFDGLWETTDLLPLNTKPQRVKSTSSSSGRRKSKKKGTSTPPHYHLQGLVPDVGFQRPSLGERQYEGAVRDVYLRNHALFSGPSLLHTTTNGGGAIPPPPYDVETQRPICNVDPTSSNTTFPPKHYQLQDHPISTAAASKSHSALQRWGAGKRGGLNLLPHGGGTLHIPPPLYHDPSHLYFINESTLTTLLEEEYNHITTSNRGGSAHQRAMGLEEWLRGEAGNSGSSSECIVDQKSNNSVLDNMNILDNVAAFIQHDPFTNPGYVTSTIPSEAPSTSGMVCDVTIRLRMYSAGQVGVNYKQPSTHPSSPPPSQEGAAIRHPLSLHNDNPTPTSPTTPSYVPPTAKNLPSGESSVSATITQSAAVAHYGALSQQQGSLGGGPPTTTTNNNTTSSSVQPTPDMLRRILQQREARQQQQLTAPRQSKKDGHNKEEVAGAIGMTLGEIPAVQPTPTSPLLRRDNHQHRMWLTPTSTTHPSLSKEDDDDQGSSSGGSGGWVSISKGITQMLTQQHRRNRVGSSIRTYRNHHVEKALTIERTVDTTTSHPSVPDHLLTAALLHTFEHQQDELQAALHKQLEDAHSHSDEGCCRWWIPADGVSIPRCVPTSGPPTTITLTMPVRIPSSSHTQHTGSSSTTASSRRMRWVSLHNAAQLFRSLRLRLAPECGSGAMCVLPAILDLRNCRVHLPLADITTRTGTDSAGANIVVPSWGVEEIVVNELAVEKGNDGDEAVHPHPTLPTTYQQYSIILKSAPPVQYTTSNPAMIVQLGPTQGTLPSCLNPSSSPSFQLHNINASVSWWGKPPTHGGNDSRAVLVANQVTSFLCVEVYLDTTTSTILPPQPTLDTSKVWILISSNNREGINNHHDDDDLSTNKSSSVPPNSDVRSRWVVGTIMTSSHQEDEGQQLPRYFKPLLNTAVVNGKDYEDDTTPLYIISTTVPTTLCPQ